MSDCDLCEPSRGGRVPVEFLNMHSFNSGGKGEGEEDKEVKFRSYILKIATLKRCWNVDLKPIKYFT